ncbi:hypothetical protein ITP53_46180 [Nonomuraea sp. K274]|uniref:Carrier domain-containing protein n=1 Tax=Nonomuraea cypriaca TaxID=1187855 RepID=A0A931AHH1_9ACTN|nr:hypothetical protein [Nonomuraea cypriaca]
MVVLPLSARTPAQLTTAAQRLAAALRAPDAPPLADVAHTLATGRATLATRAYVTATTHEEAATALETLASTHKEPTTRETPATTHKEPTARETAAPSRAPAGTRSALGEAWKAGQDVTWPAGGRRVHLPTYPFAGDDHGALTLGAPQTTEEQPPDDREAAVTELFMTTLALSDRADLGKTYFTAGGDSLTAVFLVTELRDRFGLDAPIELFLGEQPLDRLIAQVLRGPDDDLLGDLLDELER